jgi:hypothetical protein
LPGGHPYKSAAPTALSVGANATEDQVYEFATALRYGGGGETTGVAPYKTIRLGNYTGLSGAGTPRLTAPLNKQILVFADTRKAEQWNNGVTAKEETIPVGALNAFDVVLDGGGNAVEQQSADWMPLLPTVNPLANPEFTVDPGAWSPSALSPSMWYKADAIVGLSDGQAVSSWVNSGSGVAASNGTGAEQPLYKTNIQNGLPVVRFDGVDDDLTTAGANIPAAASFFLVFKTPGDTTADQRPYVTTSNRHALRLHSGGAGLATILQTPSTLTYSASVGTAAWEIHGHVYDPAALRGGRNGVWSSGGAASGGAAASNLVIASSGGGQWADMDLGELIVIPSVVSVADQQRIEGYLAWKWGLQANLPAGHPYKFDKPMATAPTSWTKAFTHANATVELSRTAVVYVGSTPGALHVNVSSSTVPVGNSAALILADDRLPVGNRQNVYVGAEYWSNNTSLIPLPAIRFYDASLATLSTVNAAAWAVPNMSFRRRLYAAAVPSGAVYWAPGFYAWDNAGSQNGDIVFDAVAVNDTEVGVIDQNTSGLTVGASWLNRYAYG